MPIYPAVMTSLLDFVSVQKRYLMVYVSLVCTMSMIVFIPASVLHCFARILTVVDCTREMNCRTPNIKLHLRTVNDLMTGTILEKL